MNKNRGGMKFQTEVFKFRYLDGLGALSFLIIIEDLCLDSVGDI